MICTKCNSKIADNSKFCQVCGNAIDSLENVVPIIDNSMDNQLINSSDIVQESTVNTNSIISDDSNYNQTNNMGNTNNQQTLNHISVEHQDPQTNIIEFNSNQQQQNQNNGNKNKNCVLKIVSTLLGIIGIVVMFFHSTIASIIFIIGIIFGVIYKSKTKNKCFGLVLNIICLILNIIFCFWAVFILINTQNDALKVAECSEKDGYLENGKCVGVTVEENEETKDNKKENNSNINDSSNSNNENTTYIGLWSCKDNGTDTSLSISPLDQIEENEYTIGLTFVNNQRYMITYSSLKWEKGTYTITLNKKDSTGFNYYDLNINIEELYESGNYQILDSTPKKYQFVVDEFYSRAFVIASDGRANYSCYKD